MSEYYYFFKSDIYFKMLLQGDLEDRPLGQHKTSCELQPTDFFF